MAIVFVSTVLAVGAMLVESTERSTYENLSNEELYELVTRQSSTGFFEAFIFLTVFGVLYIGIIEGIAYLIRYFLQGLQKSYPKDS